MENMENINETDEIEKVQNIEGEEDLKNPEHIPRNYVSQIYKIFIFESNTANLIRIAHYVDFPDVQKEILDYNKDNQDNRWNLFIGTEFPPKGVKFDHSIKEFVEKTLEEKLKDEEITVPEGFKIVNNTFVKLTKKEMYEKGLLSLEYDEKIDDLDNVVKLSKKEMYEIGKITKYQIYEHFIQEINIKIENKLKEYYNYPVQEMGTWQYKKNQAVEWLALSKEEKKEVIITPIKTLMFEILIAEAKISSNITQDEMIKRVDALANKVITKYGELEKKYGETFVLRASKKQELKDILEKEKINHYEEMNKVYNSIKI